MMWLRRSHLCLPVWDVEVSHGDQNMRTTLVIAIALVVTAFSSASQAQQSAAPAWASPSAQANAGAQAGKPEKPAPATAAVNLNTATAKQLETLPGVGPATAARILEYREKNGRFKKIEDLMNVRGIGEKTFLTLKPLIVVTPEKGLGW